MSASRPTQNFLSINARSQLICLATGLTLSMGMRFISAELKNNPPNDRLIRIAVRIGALLGEGLGLGNGCFSVTRVFVYHAKNIQQPFRYTLKHQLFQITTTLLLPIIFFCMAIFYIVLKVPDNV